MRRAPGPATLAVALSFALAAASARAVIVASGDGTQNTTAPADDPGFANVGLRGGLTAVYLGNRWVLTANHVGAGTASFAGSSYDAIPESATRFATAPGQLADLVAFKLRDDPGLPALALASAAPAVGADVVMIGHGRNRGAPTTWSGIAGWLWGAGNAMRWGTNRVAGASQDVVLGSTLSRVFWTDLTQSPPPEVTAHEAQAANGDSGGAAFVDAGATWQLAGILFAISGFEGQPSSTALYGNRTYAVDLSFYRTAILDATSDPACGDGLDDDADGLADFPDDPGCASASDLDERSPLLPCDDGADNDGDGAADFLAAGGGDLGCAVPSSPSESPQCQNGVDVDADGGIDFDGGASLDLDDDGYVDAAFNPQTPPVGRPDSDCSYSWQWFEAPFYGCGLGFEIVFLAPLLARLARVSQRRAGAPPPDARDPGGAPDPAGPPSPA